MIDALETCDVDQNKTFIEGALCSILNSLLLLILENEFGIKKSFESDIVKFGTNIKEVSKISQTIVTDMPI